VRCFGPAGLHGECTQSSWAAREPLQSNELETILTDTQSVVTISAFRTRSRPMVPREASNLSTESYRNQSHSTVDLSYLKRYPSLAAPLPYPLGSRVIR
jgi:hypothetical protein